jgi:hypothetical protein
VEAPSLPEALEQGPDMVIILGDGPARDWPESSPGIPVVVAFTGQDGQAPSWARVVRL